MRQRQAVQTTAARRKFQSFKKEEPKITRQAQVHREPFDKLYAAWKKFERGRYTTPRGARRCLLGIGYSPRDVERLLIAIGSDETEKKRVGKLGTFIDTTINLGKDQHYEIIIPDIVCERIHLGTENTKDLVIKGNVNTLGHGMKGGSITIRSCYRIQSVGSGMEGGTIKVMDSCAIGSVLGWVGDRMKGGSIVFYQPIEIIESSVGLDMLNGEISFQSQCNMSTNPKKILSSTRSPSVGNGMRGGKISFNSITGEFELLNADGKKEIYLDGEKMVGEWRP